MVKKIFYSIIISLLLMIMTFIILWNVRPRPKALTQYELEREMDNHLPFTVQFLGNTNLLFDDGERILSGILKKFSPVHDSGPSSAFLI